MQKKYLYSGVKVDYHPPKNIYICLIFADDLARVSKLRDQYLTQNLKTAFCRCCFFSPDHHFDRIHSDAKPLVVRDDERHAAAAVSHLCVVVNPLAWRGLRHDVQVHLCKKAFHIEHEMQPHAVQSIGSWPVCGAVEHLLPGQSDHVQRAVHEATCQDLLQVLREHGVVDTVVCGHILPKKESWKRKLVKTK